MEPLNLEQRVLRREARRRTLRRRRQAALVMMLILFAAVLLFLLIGRGAGTERSLRAQSRASRSLTKTQSSHERRPASVSASTPSSGRPGSKRAAILMYHVINSPPPDAPFPGLYVSPREFAAQMHALAAAGYHAVTMDQLRAYWIRGAPLPAGKPIVLSFDNGYQSQYTQALPVLRQLGWVGVENLQLTGLPPSQGGLSQTQVRGLLSAGWELDTQGFSHADLITLDAAELHYQVAVARSTIQRRYHVPANWFCYPSGHYNSTVVAAVRAAGYIGSTTVVPGWAGPRSDLYRLPRLRVLGGTSPQALLELISGVRPDGQPPSSYPST